MNVVLASDVFRAWDRAGITYCVWKGSFHIDDSLEGRSDLDILIDPGRIGDVHSSLESFGFHQFRAAPSRAGLAVEDFLGFESVPGRILHFHLYYRLVVGERHLDRFRVPWERYVLDTRCRLENVYVADPAVEAVLLLIRAALRLGIGGLSTRLRIVNTGVPTELGWLLEHTDRERVLLTAGAWLGAPGRSAVERCLCVGPTIKNLAGLRSVVRRELASQSAVRGFRAVIRRWWRTITWARRGVYRRYLDRPVLLGRGGSGGGLLVALIGADGSGKSTLARDLRRWFSPKLDTMHVYFGSGDGHASLIRWPMKVLHRRRLRRMKRGKTASTQQGHPRLLRAAKTVWALTLAYEKTRKLRKVMVARNRGLIVICDRYPQTQFRGENDGPLLAGWHKSPSPARRFLASIEARPYELADRFMPDLILRLNVDRTTASTRRPDLDCEYLQRRIDLVHALRFEGSLFGIVEIDASRPFEEVFRHAASAIWSRA